MAEQREAYLERLADLLPVREAGRVRRDVEAMIHDRVDALLEAEPTLDRDAAVARALAALGPPETLADSLVSRSLEIPLATRRAYVRALWILFGGHLVLSIVLTVARTQGAVVPALLGPLPTEPWHATALSVLAIFLMDAGALLVLFVLFRSRWTAVFQTDDRPRWTRKEAVEGLVLIALLAVIVNLFLRSLFAVTEGKALHTFLADDLIALVPFLNVVLGLFALRNLLRVLDLGGRAGPLLADILASLAGAGLMVVAATRSEIVRFPTGRLTHDTATVLGDLITRVFMLFLIVGALMLTVRAVRHLLHLPRVFAAR